MSLFEKIKVPLRKVGINRYGKNDTVYVVVQNANDVIYYEDVEDGLNVSSLDVNGNIEHHWCNQGRLGECLELFMTPDDERMRRGLVQLSLSRCDKIDAH